MKNNDYQGYMPSSIPEKTENASRLYFVFNSEVR
jgi:hypothetical protein